MAQNLDALAAGQVDLVQAFEPFVSLAEARAIGVPLLGAHERGETAYTSFISTEAHLERYDGAFRTMAEAISRFPSWLEAEGVGELVRVVRDRYPQIDPAVLERSLGRYQAARLWSCRPEISRRGFARLALSMRDSGFIGSVAPYEACVASWAQQKA